MSAANALVPKFGNEPLAAAALFSKLDKHAGACRLYLAADRPHAAAAAADLAADAAASPAEAARTLCAAVAALVAKKAHAHAFALVQRRRAVLTDDVLRSAAKVRNLSELATNTTVEARRGVAQMFTRATNRDQLMRSDALSFCAAERRRPGPARRHGGRGAGSGEPRRTGEPLPPLRVHQGARGHQCVVMRTLGPRA